MKIFGKKIAVFVACIFFLQTSHSFANSLIDNNAFGYVSGNIVQDSSDDGVSEVNVGSVISYSNSNISGATAYGYVNGNIIVNGATRLNIATVNVR